MTSTLPEGLTERDWQVSATVRDLDKLDESVQLMADLPIERRPGSLLDLGCGIGGLSKWIAGRLGIDDIHGVDMDEERLEISRSRGLETYKLDLNTDRLPFDDQRFGLVTSFGAFEHLLWYDNTVSETSRVLEDRGFFLLSMPNLGAYTNRIAILFGRQPRDVEISQDVLAGVLPQYKGKHGGKPLAHVHSATYRAMVDLLEHHDLEVVHATGFSPDAGVKWLPVLDAIFERFPSISRRFVMLARRRPRTVTGR